MYYLESDQKHPKQISEEDVADSEVILIHHKNTTWKKHTCTKNVE